MLSIQISFKDQKNWLKMTIKDEKKIITAKHFFKCIIRYKILPLNSQWGFEATKILYRTNWDFSSLDAIMR